MSSGVKNSLSAFHITSTACDGAEGGAQRDERTMMMISENSLCMSKDFFLFVYTQIGCKRQISLSPAGDESASAKEIGDNRSICF